MRRVVSVLTVGAMIAAMMVASAAPAMADTRSAGFTSLGGVSGFDFDDGDIDFDDGFFGFGDGFFGFGDGFGDFEQESESGDVDLSFGVSNEGDFASQCTPATQFGNTGNLQTGSSFLQFGSDADDFEAEGIEFSVEPETAVECSSTVQQSAAASG